MRGRAPADGAPPRRRRRRWRGRLQDAGRKTQDGVPSALIRSSAAATYQVPVPPWLFIPLPSPPRVSYLCAYTYHPSIHPSPPAFNPSLCFSLCSSLSAGLSVGSSVGLRTHHMYPRILYRPRVCALLLPKFPPKPQPKSQVQVSRAAYPEFTPAPARPFVLSHVPCPMSIIAPRPALPRTDLLTRACCTLYCIVKLCFFSLPESGSSRLVSLARWVRGSRYTPVQFRSTPSEPGSSSGTDDRNATHIFCRANPLAARKHCAVSGSMISLCLASCGSC